MSQHSSVSGFAVAPTSLHGNSRSLIAAADSIRDTAAVHLPAAVAGAQAHPNLLTSQALRRAHDAWTSRLAGHADRIEGHGHTLRSCAEEYVRIDNRVFDSLAGLLPRHQTAEV